MKASSKQASQLASQQASRLESLLTQHKKAMLRVAFKITRRYELAEEVVQDVGMTLASRPGALDSYRGEVGKERGWLCACVRNKAITASRISKRAYHQTADLENMLETDQEQALSDEGAQLIEMQDRLDMQRVAAKLASLPAKQRQAVEMHVVQDMTFVEIAKKIDCNYDTVKANYRHGMLQLRSLLGS